MIAAIDVFDYTVLEAGTSRIVAQRTQEIRERIETIQRSTIEIGQRLLDVRACLGHGQWGAWLASEFRWSNDTAENLMSTARLALQNPKFSEFEDRFARSAMYLLASDSTPESVREVALSRAEAGEKIGHKEVKQLVAEHRTTPAPAQTGEGEIDKLIARAAAVGYTLTPRGEGWQIKKGTSPWGGVKTLEELRQQVSIWETQRRDRIIASEAVEIPRAHPTCAHCGHAGSILIGKYCESCHLLKQAQKWEPGDEMRSRLCLALESAKAMTEPIIRRTQIAEIRGVALAHGIAIDAPETPAAAPVIPTPLPAPDKDTDIRQHIEGILTGIIDKLSRSEVRLLYTILSEDGPISDDEAIEVILFQAWEQLNELLDDDDFQGLVPWIVEGTRG
jgi:hypothetical protein